MWCGHFKLPSNHSPSSLQQGGNGLFTGPVEYEICLVVALRRGHVEHCDRAAVLLNGRGIRRCGVYLWKKAVRLTTGRVKQQAAYKGARPDNEEDIHFREDARDLALALRYLAKPHDSRTK